MQPLDVVKTRLQLQSGTSGPGHYSSLTDVFRKMYKVEGPLSFYKGILPPIMADTPKRAIKFFTFEQFKKIFSYGTASPSPFGLTLAGLCSGTLEGFIINPFEVVKIKLQADRNTFKTQKSTFAMAREILKEGGFGDRGLNKALTSTLFRHGIFNMVYFSFYHNVKDIIPKSQDARLDFLRRFAIGLMAGVLGSTLNIPFDVAKSRIQGPQPVPGQVKYHGCFRTIKIVYTEEGFRALYKGFLPKIMRLGPGAAIMMLTYEAVYERLQKWF